MNEIISKYENFLTESMELSSDSDSNCEEDITVDDKHLIVINSLDRNYKEGDTTFSYTINTNNSNSHGNLSNNYKNISSISIESLYIPNKYLDIHTLHGLKKDGQKISSTKHLQIPKLNNVQYLILKISDLNNNIDGSNSIVNNSTSILVVDDVITRNSNSGGFTVSGSDYVSIGNLGKNITGGTDNSFLAFRNVASLEKIHISPKANLNDLKIELYLPNGQLLEYLNEHLTVSHFKYNNTNKTIDVYISEYFSPDEYMVGNTIIFKDIVLNTSNTIIENEFHNFINRNIGHTIIDLVDSGSTTSGLFNVIQIPLEYTINKSTGESVPNTFTCVDTEQHNVSSGTILNRDMQHVFFIKVNTKKKINKKCKKI
tara:strand:- start:13147 stop:14262 length:1116 start_codon:yes stop_codon:yes gene_type:complete